MKNIRWNSRLWAVLLVLYVALFSVAAPTLMASVTYGTTQWDVVCIDGHCYVVYAGCSGAAFNCAEVVEENPS